uniref:Uncharacterized protein n=1 Tax=Rhizophora mucronata TaxID=61149 RepID=A0A2P2LT30_RHIMU
MNFLSLKTLLSDYCNIINLTSLKNLLHLASGLCLLP